MHIVVIYQHYLGPNEPGFSRLNEYAKRWVDDGHKVSVIASQVNYMTGRKRDNSKSFLLNRTIDENGVNVFRSYIPATYQNSKLQKIFALSIFILSSTIATFFVKKTDIILVSSPPLPLVLPGLFLSFLRKVPFVFDIRDLWPETGYSLGVLREGSLSAKFFSWIERVAVANATGINVLTPAFREDLIQRKMVLPDKIKVIPNGIDLSKINQYEKTDDIRRNFGWEERFVVLYAGAHGMANHLEQLIEVAEILRDIPEIFIACIGDGICLPQLKRKVSEKGLRNICFYGPYSREETTKLISNSDVCTAVLKPASAFEKVYPNKIFEYMAHEKPIILTIDGAAKGLVERAQSGIFVPPEMPVAFGKAVRFLKNNPDIRRKMGLNGKKYVTKNFKLDNLYTQMTDFLISVAKH